MARDEYLTGDRGRLGHLEVGLLQDQDLIERLQLELGRGARRRKVYPGRTPEAPLQVALAQVARVERHPQPTGELPDLALVGHSGHLRLPKVGADDRPPSELHQVAERHPFLPWKSPRRGNLSGHGHVVAPVQAEHRVHHDRVPVLEADRGDRDAPQVACRRRVGRRSQLQVDRLPVGEARPPVRRQEHAVDREPPALGVGREPARGPKDVQQVVPLRQLVVRRTDDGAAQLDPSAPERHEDHVALLQDDVPRGVSVQQVGVEVERDHVPVPALHAHAPQVPQPGGPSGRVEGVRDGCDRRELVGPRLAHLARDVDLVGPQAGDRHAHVGRAPLDAGVGPGEPGPEERAQVFHGHVRDVDLTHVRDDDEPLAIHLQIVRELDLAGEDQHELVARAHAVAVRDRAGEERLELRGGAGEDVQAEDRQAVEGVRGLPPRLHPGRGGLHARPQGHEGETVGRHHRHAEGLQCARGLRAHRRQRVQGHAGQELIQHVRRDAGRPELCSDLARAEPRLEDALADGLGILLQEPHRLGPGRDLGHRAVRRAGKRTKRDRAQDDDG